VLSGLLFAGSLRPVAASAAPDNRAAFAHIADAADTMRLALNGGAWLAVDAGRHALAEAVAPFAGVEPWELEDAWAMADPRRQSVVYTALAQIDRPYVSNGDSPDSGGFDCSGLTQYAWASAGVVLDHQSETQAAAGFERSFAGALPGDLMHYPGHIGLFLGAGRAIVHAVNHATGLAVGVANDHMTHVISPIN
jgi:cell wall-associated NlpC family hydrolase